MKKDDKDKEKTVNGTVSAGTTNTTENTNTSAVTGTERTGTTDNWQPWTGGVTSSYPKLTNQDLINIFSPMNAEQRRKEERREARNRGIAALGDALSSLAGLVATTKGAPPVQTSSLAERYRQRAEQLRQQRQANNVAYLNAYLNAQGNEARQQAAQSDLIAKQREDEERHRTNKEREAADLLKANAYAESQKATQNKANEEMNTEKELRPYKQKLLEAQANNANASANEHDRRGTKSWVSSSSGSSGGGGRKPYGVFLGKTYATRADYDKAVISYAKKNGIPTTEISGGIRSEKGAQVGGTLRNRPISTIAAESEKHYRANASAGRGTNNSGNWAAGLKF